MYRSSQGCLTATGTHTPYGITQCYLPPGGGDIPALTPVEAGTPLSDPGGMQGWVDLVWLCFCCGQQSSHHHHHHHQHQQQQQQQQRRLSVNVLAAPRSRSPTQPPRLAEHNADVDVGCRGNAELLLTQIHSCRHQLSQLVTSVSQLEVGTPSH